MARVSLDIADVNTRLMLKAMLVAEGHEVVEARADVAVSDSVRRAVIHARTQPALVLAPMAQIAQAVGAMRQGVYGYIFVPLQPGEAGLMVERAAATQAGPRGPEPAAASANILEDSEARLILSTLRQCKYNRTKAARALGNRQEHAVAEIEAPALGGKFPTK